MIFVKDVNPGYHSFWAAKNSAILAARPFNMNKGRTNMKFMVTWDIPPANWFPSARSLVQCPRQSG